MRKKVIRLKLTCRECHNVGYVELSKNDLKKLRDLLTKPPKTRLGDWTRINYHEDPR